MKFYACRISDGLKIAELPLSLNGEITRALGTPTKAGFTLAVNDPRCPTDWEQITSPFTHWILVCTDDETILWGGIFTGRVITGKPSIGLTASSPEEYLDRRYVGDKRFEKTDQTEIAKWLLNHCVSSGINIHYITSPTDKPVVRDRWYHADETATVLQRLTELSNVIGGPEWYMTLKWQTPTCQNIQCVCYIGNPKIGITDDSPSAIFEMPGSITEFKYEQRWSKGDAATYVVATGSGEGESKPMSNPQIDPTVESTGIPRLEIYQNYSSVKLKPTLDAHAQKILNAKKQGIQVWSISCRTDQYPKVDTDWNMGDKVKLQINLPYFKHDEELRIIGWKISENGLTTTPIIANYGEEKEEE